MVQQLAVVSGPMESDEGELAVELKCLVALEDSIFELGVMAVVEWVGYVWQELALQYVYAAMDAARPVLFRIRAKTAVPNHW